MTPKFDEQEVIFKGTPARLWTLVAAYENNRISTEKPTALFTWSGDQPAPDAEDVYISFIPGSFYVHRLTPELSRILVSIPKDDPNTPQMWSDWNAVVAELRRLGLIADMALVDNRPATQARESGPTERTRQRFEVFQKLKLSHPTWSQARVAQEASDEIGEVVTEDTVRNTYRLMGEKWPRGDRTR